MRASRPPRRDSGAATAGADGRSARQSSTERPQGKLRRASPEKLFKAGFKFRLTATRATAPSKRGPRGGAR